MTMPHIKIFVLLGFVLFGIESQAIRCDGVGNPASVEVANADQIQSVLSSLRTRLKLKNIESRASRSASKSKVQFLFEYESRIPQFYSIATDDAAFASDTIVKSLKSSLAKSSSAEHAPLVREDLSIILQNLLKTYTSDQNTISIKFANTFDGITTYVFVDFPVMAESKALLPINLGQEARTQNKFRGERLEIRIRPTGEIEVHSGTSLTFLYNGQLLVGSATSHGISLNFTHPTSINEPVIVRSGLGIGQSRHFFDNDGHLLGQEKSQAPEILKTTLATTLGLARQLYPNNSIRLELSDRSYNYPAENFRAEPR